MCAFSNQLFFTTLLLYLIKQLCHQRVLCMCSCVRVLLWWWDVLARWLALGNPSNWCEKKMEEAKWTYYKLANTKPTVTIMESNIEIFTYLHEICIQAQIIFMSSKQNERKMWKIFVALCKMQMGLTCSVCARALRTPKFDLLIINFLIYFLTNHIQHVSHFNEMKMWKTRSVMCSCIRCTGTLYGAHFIDLMKEFFFLEVCLWNIRIAEALHHRNCDEIWNLK